MKDEDFDIRAALESARDDVLDERSPHTLDGVSAAKQRHRTRVVAAAAVVPIAIVAAAFGAVNLLPGSEPTPGTAGLAAPPSATAVVKPSPTPPPSLTSTAPTVQTTVDGLSVTAPDKVRVELILGSGPYSGKLPVTLKNNGSKPTGAMKLQLTKETPIEVTASPGCTRTKDFIECEVADLPPGQERKLDLNVTIMGQFFGPLPLTGKVGGQSFVTKFIGDKGEAERGQLDISLAGPKEVTLIPKDGGYEGVVRMEVSGIAPQASPYNVGFGAGGSFGSITVTTISGPFQLGRSYKTNSELGDEVDASQLIGTGTVVVELRIRATGKVRYDLVFHAGPSEKANGVLPQDTDFSNNELRVGIRYN
ncbi:hypothetical protein [Longispora albida]|uniref:hypothetical protein n=1 Tax=Longispora albida TaxID=203523 RepID=UPI00035DB328|nr:hypothetical protein [Longispora albida]